MANPFVHVELHTHDPERAKKFYTELFDWKLDNVPDMDYTIVNVGEGTGGGMMKTAHTFLTICACGLLVG
ncbi:MAG: VOC family protein [Syntrophobacteraceae bacterium]|jgi:predicted enzyme related to lactoylglutathione lyase